MIRKVLGIAFLLTAFAVPAFAIDPFITCDTVTCITTNLGSDRTIYIKPGTYSFTSSLNLSGYDGLRLVGAGYGTNLSFSVSDQAIYSWPGNKQVIENLRISGSMGRAITFTSSSQVTVRGCWISGATVNNGTNSYTSAIMFEDTVDSNIEGNFLSGNGVNSTAWHPSPEILLTGSCKRNRVTGNRSTSTYVTMHVGIQTTSNIHDSRNNLVAHNDLSGATTRVVPDTGGSSVQWGYGIYLYGGDTNIGPKDNVIEANQIRNTGGNGIYVHNSARTTILGNQLENVCQTNTGGQIGEGAIVSNSLAVESLIHNNTINGTGQAALRIDSSETVVSANNISDATGYDIYVLGSGNGISLVNNLLVGGQVSISTSAQVLRRGNRFSTGAIQGTATLSSGAVTINTTEVRTGDRIDIGTAPGGSGTPGHRIVSAITNGTSFTVYSTSATDGGNITWEIVH